MTVGASAGRARRVAEAPYLLKWLFLGPLIGALAGAGVIVLWFALLACTHLVLSSLAGYHVPTTLRQGRAPGSARVPRPWALPVVVALGALAGALLVARFAPEESEGNGTDAAIALAHCAPTSLSLRAVAVRLIASALTIGSGGSGGQAGPSGHIGAGAGSWVARRLGLGPSDASTAVAIGIAAAIGAVLGAPIGGAVLGAQILYRDRVELSALYPCALASGVAYAVFGAAVGYGPVFGHVATHLHPGQLPWFVVIGLLGGAVGLLYAKGFYGISSVFEALPLPRWVRPAVGGALVGVIAIRVPEVLGTGLGWVQKGLDSGLAGLPLWLVLVLPLARIVTTGLSVGSGGSGGIFAPGLVIGGSLGVAFWRVVGPHVGSVGHDPAPYVIVGMMACLGSISRAPLAVMLIAAEMTGGYWILLPALVAVVPAWLIVRASGDTIYRSQLRAAARTA